MCNIKQIEDDEVTLTPYNIIFSSKDKKKERQTSNTCFQKLELCVSLVKPFFLVFSYFSRLLILNLILIPVKINNQETIT